VDNRHEIEQRVQDLEAEVARLKLQRFRWVRRRAAFTLFGLPAYDIALGPDFEKGEMRGHAKGFIAIGDLATGVFALGGLARGVFAFGGLALGVFAFGGVSLGLGLALGGLAVGSLAIGGGAVGGVAIGGGAAGYYAAGGGAVGQYVVSAERRDPEAEEFFRKHHLPLPVAPTRRPQR
jgi:hypothetical protein